MTKAKPGGKGDTIEPMKSGGNGSTIEPLFTIQEICGLWHAGPDLVRKVFRNRPGVMLLGGRGKQMWRIPASLVLEAMIERGYTAEQAERAMKLASK